MSKREIVWDLSEIFPSVMDPSVQRAMDKITAMAERFKIPWKY